MDVRWMSDSSAAKKEYQKTLYEVKQAGVEEKYTSASKTSSAIRHTSNVINTVSFLTHNAGIAERLAEHMTGFSQTEEQSISTVLVC